MPSSGQCLIIFAKAPRRGTVKTRLQAALPENRVRALYVAFVKDTLAMAQRVCGVGQQMIAFTPPDGEPMLRRTLGATAKNFKFVPQYGADLGERMRGAFKPSFEHGATSVVIIGTDSPSLPARLVEEAFAALARCDLVLGPSMDGGYYLIGVRNQKSETRMRFLDGIEWSTERVLEQTIAKGRSARLRVHLLPPWYDVDDAGSLRFLYTHLAAMAACGSDELPRHTWSALKKLKGAKPGSHLNP